MKKTSTLILASVLALGANAQLAKKYAFFEHFTQASCGPCASQNPTFQSRILNYYTEGVHHVAYHTSWPGVDPMNAHNKTQVQSRVTNYGVNGVPNMQMNGSNQGSPTNISQKMVNDILAEGSPIKVAVVQTFNDPTFSVKVTVTTVGDKPAGTYKLLTALVENEVVYSTAPGNNGEKDFPNVFRLMLTADNGDAFALPEKGQSIEFNFTADSKSPWVNNNMYSLAAVQSTDKSILNSGASTDPVSPITYGFLNNPGKTVDAGTPSSITNFTFEIKNTGSTAERYALTFGKDMPNDWTGSFIVNGTAITSGTEVTVPANSTYTGTMAITPGTTPYVGAFSVSMESVDNPGTIKFSKSVQVISNVRDLVISNTEAAANKMPVDFVSIYMNGINNAGNNVHAASDSKFLLNAFKEGALTGVKSIYYNVGFSTNSLTDDMIIELKKFMDNSGNLFIAGQDLGWEYCDAAQGVHYSASAAAFFKEYLHAGYTADHAQSTSLIAETAEYFGSTGTTAINNTFYGTASSTYYPDRINSQNGGIPVFHYDAAKTKVAGIRFADNTKKSKVVYLGIGPEQLSDNAKKEEIIKLSHDYFYSTVGINKNNNNRADLLADCYPNPSNGLVTFTFGNLENDMTLNIQDVTGKTVFTQAVWSGMTKTSVNTQNLESGVYFYQLVDGNTVIATKKLTIVK